MDKHINLNNRLEPVATLNTVCLVTGPVSQLRDATTAIKGNADCGSVTCLALK